MQLKDIYEHDIDRDINGVIKVAQNDEKIIEQELEEYIICLLYTSPSPRD